MSHRLPPLNAVRAFESAARLGSFVAASDELHVTQPAVGRHVKLLEANLGVRLFDRNPRGVVLTPAGQQFFEQVSSALQTIAEASLDLRSAARTPALRLVAVPGLAARWLRPRLAQFRQTHPDVRITLEFNAGFTDPATHGADIGIGYGNPRDYTGAVRILMRPAIFPVCAPQFLEQLQAPLGTPSDLLKQPLLHEDDGTWWGQWLRACGVRSKTPADMAYDSADQIIGMAIAGEGIALCNALQVEQELLTGQLVRPLPQECKLQPYVLVLPSGPSSALARVFVHWLQGQFAASP